MNPLVSPAWLMARQNLPGTVVVDATLPPVGVVPPVDTHARYLASHIPGAVFFDIDRISDHSTGLPHMLPTAEAFATSMAALGIDSEDTIVVYEQAGVFSAPRAWWMLRSFGAREVCLLEGGLAAWIAAGLPTESGTATPAPATFHATLDGDAVKSFAQLQPTLNGAEQVLDARSAGRFAGTAPEPRAGLSSGHMPGAKNVPFPELVQDGRMKSADALREYFAAKAVDLHEPITTSCGSGVTAAVVLLGLELAGATNVSLYDGSWAEYAQHPDAVIEKTSE
jgi:thiosulfate/3-mercaptopyruvate sulfurtransferase